MVQEGIVLFSMIMVAHCSSIPEVSDNVCPLRYKGRAHKSKKRVVLQASLGMGELHHSDEVPTTSEVPTNTKTSDDEVFDTIDKIKSEIHENWNFQKVVIPPDHLISAGEKLVDNSSLAYYRTQSEVPAMLELQNAVEAASPGKINLGAFAADDEQHRNEMKKKKEKEKAEAAKKAAAEAAATCEEFLQDGNAQQNQKGTVLITNLNVRGCSYHVSSYSGKEVWDVPIYASLKKYSGVEKHLTHAAEQAFEKGMRYSISDIKKKDKSQVLDALKEKLKERLATKEVLSITCQMASDCSEVTVNEKFAEGDGQAIIKRILDECACLVMEMPGAVDRNFKTGSSGEISDKYGYNIGHRDYLGSQNTVKETMNQGQLSREEIKAKHQASGALRY